MVFIFLISIYSVFLIVIAVKFLLSKNYIPSKNYNSTVSVLVPFKNEENNIKNIIENLKKQNYNNELVSFILINDNSTDNSYEIAEQEIVTDNRFKLLNLTSKHGKKQALLLGINNCESDIIIHTDADVILNVNWVTTIVNFISENKCKLVLAPVLYKNESSIFEKLQSLEITNIAGITAGSALANMPLMANGANIAYHKSIKNIFEESINNHISGDDMFFLEKVKKQFPKQIKYLKSHEAIVYTNAEKHINSFVNQRIRWFGKSSSFSNIYIIIVGLLTTAINFLTIIGLIVSIFYTNFLQLYLVFIIIKFLSEFITTAIYAKYFKKLSILFLTPVLFFVYPFYVSVIAFLSVLIKPKWK